MTITPLVVTGASSVLGTESVSSAYVKLNSAMTDLNGALNLKQTNRIHAAGPIDGTSTDTTTVEAALSTVGYTRLLAERNGDANTPYTSTWEQSFKFPGRWDGASPAFAKVQLNRIYPLGDIKTDTTIYVGPLEGCKKLEEAIAYLHDRRRSNQAVVTIQLADGAYSPTSLAFRHPDIDPYTVKIVGNTADPTKVVLTFDATNNQCGFYSYQSKLPFLNGMTINGSGAWKSKGVWNDQCYGAGILAEGSGAQGVIGGSFRVNYFYYGIRASRSASITCLPGSIVTNSGDVGYFASFNASMIAKGCSSYDASHLAPGLGFGFLAEGSAYIDCDNSVAQGNNIAGFAAQLSGSMWAHDTTSKLNLYGHLVREGGMMEANGFAGMTESSQNGSGVGAQSGGFMNIDKMNIHDNQYDGVIAEGGRAEGNSLTVTNNPGTAFKAIKQGKVVAYGSKAASTGNGSLYYVEPAGAYTSEANSYGASTIIVT